MTTAYTIKVIHDRVVIEAYEDVGKVLGLDAAELRYFADQLHRIADILDTPFQGGRRQSFIDLLRQFNKTNEAPEPEPEPEPVTEPVAEPATAIDRSRAWSPNSSHSRGGGGSNHSLRPRRIQGNPRHLASKDMVEDAIAGINVLHRLYGVTSVVIARRAGVSVTWLSKLCRRERENFSVAYVQALSDAILALTEEAEAKRG